MVYISCILGLVLVHHLVEKIPLKLEILIFGTFQNNYYIHVRDVYGTQLFDLLAYKFDSNMFELKLLSRYYFQFKCYM